MPDTTYEIDLGDQLTDYAHRKVASGEFASVNDVVIDALRRAEERDQRLERLDDLIREGEESGAPEPFDFENFLYDTRTAYKGAGAA